MIPYEMKDRYTIADLAEIVALLRSKDGCPWDKVQTHASIRTDLIEETYEVIEAIDQSDPVLLQEELGDLLFAAVKVARFFHIDPEEALEGTCEKFIRRFSAVEAAVTAQGQDMKDVDVSQLMVYWNRAKHPAKDEIEETEEEKGQST